MTTSRATPIHLDRPGALLAAVPTLLGFNPTDSLVVITHRGPDRAALGLVLRSDLAAVCRPEQLADHLVRPARLQEATAATLVVVGGTATEWIGDHRIEEIARRFDEAEIPVLHLLWTARIGAGAPWACFADPTCGGEVDDPKRSPVTRLVSPGGAEATTTRADLERLVERAPTDRLARRARLFHDDETVTTAEHPKRRYQRVRDAARDYAAGKTFTDGELRELAVAIDDAEVRDALLTGRDRAEETALRQLWSMLTRELPEPECARAACLLAVNAYLASDGVLAGIAVEAALTAEPDNRLAALLADSLAAGLPPARLREGLARLAERTRERIGVGHD